MFALPRAETGSVRTRRLRLLARLAGPLVRMFQIDLWGIHPARMVAAGYASYILLGWIFLALPIAHKVEGAGALNHLFIATSAVSTTGLTTISVSDSYNLFGQIVVLALIQLGGVG